METANNSVSHFANFSLTDSSVNVAAGPGTTGLKPPPTSPELPLRSQVILLRYAVTHGEDEQAKIWMNELETKGMLKSTGFTTQDSAGNGLLQIAALYGHTEVLKLLLDRGININSVDRNHGTALQAAIYMGRAEVVQLLLGWANDDKTRDRINVNIKGGYYGCALQVAAYKADSNLVLKLVRDYMADVNIPGGKFGFPLQAAVRTGLPEVVKPILSNGSIKVNAKGGKYGTALQAVARGKYRTREKLPEISRGHVLSQNAQSSSGRPINLHNNAEEDKYRDVAIMLLDKGAKLDGGSGILGNPINAGR